MASARWGAAAVACVGYAVLAHLAAADPSPDLLDVVVATAPPFVVALVMAWRSSHKAWMLLLCVAVLIGMYGAAGWLLAYYNWVFLMQHIAMQALLGLAFGQTLRAGQMPLVSRLAGMVHGPLSPALVRYTRQVTWAWTVYFCAMGVVSLLLFWLAPIAVWSVFANLLGVPLLVLMFAAEFVVRVFVLAPSDRTGPLQAVRAYLRAHPAGVPPLR